MTNVALALALAVCVVGSAGRAAASIDLKFDEINPNSGASASLHFNGGAVTASVGQLLWEASNDQGTPPISLFDSSADGDLLADNVLTFCIELGQHVASSTHTYAKTALSAAPDPSISGNPLTSYKIGAERAAALDKLADNFWSAAVGTSVVDAVAFQLAVWELVHESPTSGANAVPGALDVSQNSGTFYVNASPSSGALSDAITKANDWLGQLGSLSSNDSLSLIALTHEFKQDQIVQYVSGGGQGDPTVPEPTALLVWSCLGACVGLAGSRRSRG